jgi:small subunit ribosomal protein S2
MSKEITVKELLEAGTHFGHQTHKWNPKMKKYVFGERNGIYIIDLTQTVPMAQKAYEFLKKTSAAGKPVLFVGTKRQASKVIRDTAESCGAFHVSYRWLGGMLTNLKTISQSIDKLRKVEKMKENGDYGLLTKKEQSKIEKEVIKLERNLGGIKNMRKLPGAMFVVDPNNERIAILEANRLKIPVIAITDTNCNPDGIDYIVPGNDDAIKSITALSEYFAAAVNEGAKKMKKTDGKVAGKDLALEKEMLAKAEAK